MLVLVPDTGNWYRVDGFELVANPMLNPVQLPEVDQLNVCGKLKEAPLAGLFNVAEQTALARPTAPKARALQSANNKKKRPAARRALGLPPLPGITGMIAALFSRGGGRDRLRRVPGRS